MSSIFNILVQYRGSYLVDVPRQLFAWLDVAIYSMISNVYGLIEDLARIEIFDTGVIGNFYNKIYLLLSIFMLFKISFSIVSYILDPAKASDKSGGFGKMFVNIIVTFVMILSAPVAFKYLTKLQNAILDDNVIPNFVFQTDESNSYSPYNGVVLGDAENCEKWSNDKYNVMRAYTGPKPLKVNNNGDLISVIIYRSFFNISTTEHDVGKGMHIKSSGVDVKSGKTVFDYFCNDVGEIVTPGKMAAYINAYADEVDEPGSNGYYFIEYRFGIATVVGVVALLMLISIAMDVAVRTIKLAFYQLIAPIPIISYIDPKSGKGGMFSKWLKALGKTWVSLFVRLFSLYFMVFIVSKINENMYDDLVRSDYTVQSSKFFVMTFLVIGALIFAKQLPRLIEELFPGMKMGKMEVNPFKKVKDEALGGKVALGTAGFAAGAAIGAVSKIGNIAKNKIDDMKKPEYKEKKQLKKDIRSNGANLKKAQTALGEHLSKKPDVNGEKAKYERANREIEKKYKKNNIPRKKWDPDDNKTWLENKAKINQAKKDYDSWKKEKNRLQNNAGNLEAQKAELQKRASELNVSSQGKLIDALNGVKNVVINAGRVLSQAASGAKIGYGQTSNLKFDLKRIGQESARIRNYKDEYGLGDRAKDWATDFFGIRGLSGTSSEVGNKVTQLSNDLARIEQSIGIMTKSLSDAMSKAGSNAGNIISFESGRPVINESYAGKDTDPLYADLKYFAEQINAEFDNKERVQKEIKKQQKIKDMPGNLKK